MTCENIMHLSKRYSRQQLEEACQYVITAKMFIGYRRIHDAIKSTNQPDTQATGPAQQGTRKNSDLVIDDTCITFTQAHLRGSKAFGLPTPPAFSAPDAATSENIDDTNGKEQQ